MLLVRGLPQPERPTIYTPWLLKPLSESATTQGGGELEGFANLPASSQQCCSHFTEKKTEIWKNWVTQ